MKKQFRLYDIYRAATMDATDEIRGIKSYRVERDKHSQMFDVFVQLQNDEICHCWSNGVASDENDLRKFIRDVNKKLQNCKNLAKSLKTKAKINRND